MKIYLPVRIKRELIGQINEASSEQALAIEQIYQASHKFHSCAERRRDLRGERAASED